MSNVFNRFSIYYDKVGQVKNHEQLEQGTGTKEIAEQLEVGSIHPKIALETDSFFSRESEM